MDRPCEGLGGTSRHARSFSIFAACQRKEWVGCGHSLDIWDQVLCYDELFGCLMVLGGAAQLALEVYGVMKSPGLYFLFPCDFLSFPTILETFFKSRFFDHKMAQKRPKQAVFGAGHAPGPGSLYGVMGGPQSPQ